MQATEDDTLVPTTAEEPDPLAPLPDQPEDMSDPADDESVGHRSLLDDLEALVSDARTYFDAEIAFQKTRAAFMADSLKRTIIFAIIGAFFAMLATIGLAIGAIIALTPILTAWGATGVVVAVLAVAAFLFVRRSSKAWNGMMDAVRQQEEAREADNVET